MNQPPVRLSRHRVGVLLPQIADVVRFLHLLHVARVKTVLAVEKLERTNILIAAMDRLHLAVAPQLARNLCRGNRDRQKQQEDEHHRAKEHEALLALAYRNVPRFLHHKTRQRPISGSVWRLLFVISSTRTEFADTVRI